jgi:nucleotide-binding universal stress UspA family protein
VINLKILVCIDGSSQSEKALGKALEIAGGCSADEVTIMTVFEDIYDFPETTTDRLPITHEDLKRFEKIGEKEREVKKEMLEEAAQKFETLNLKVNTHLDCGHPAETIARVADEGGYDMIVIGSRGLGGLKKMLLGSVSNAVLQEAKTSVLVVK